MFPGTEFRSAFAQLSSDGLALCAKPEKAKSRTRTAYLWAHRLPALDRPQVVLAGEVHAPIGAKSVARLIVPEGQKLQGLERVREWQLEPASGGAPLAVPVTPRGDALELDLTKTKAAPGEYALAELWDWDRATANGKVWLHPFGDLKSARLTAKSRGRLAEGNGAVGVTLEGTDFQFLEKVAMEKAGSRQATPVEIPFTLPKGRRAGVQQTVETEIDTRTWARGPYRLLLVQGDGLTYEVPFEVLPPNPQITNVPLRVNTGDKTVRLTLRGSGLDRVEALNLDGGEVELAPASGATERCAVLRLPDSAKKGDRLALRMKIKGVEDPVEIAGALQVAGPRPHIQAVQKSLSQEETVALRADEVPAGGTASFALSVQDVEGTPAVEVSCDGDRELRQKVRLMPGDRVGAAKLDVAGEGVLFLSLDPGAVGQPGCRLTAVITAEATGSSDPRLLGQVVRVPRIAQFVLTDEKAGDAAFYGLLKGQGLETVEKTGWDAEKGLPVQAIPTPAPGEAGRQVLRVALPWPARPRTRRCSFWLRGAGGRATAARY